MPGLTWPTLVIGGSGPYVAWSDLRSGNAEIYLAHHDGNAWSPLAGSANGGGGFDHDGFLPLS